MAITLTTGLLGAVAAAVALTLDFSHPRTLLLARLLCITSAIFQAEIRRNAEKLIKERNDTRLTWARPDQQVDSITACDAGLLSSWQATQAGAFMIVLQAILHCGLKQNVVPLFVLSAVSLEQTWALPFVRAAKLISENEEAPPPEDWHLRARPGVPILSTLNPSLGLTIVTELSKVDASGTYEEAQAILQGVRIEARTRTYDVLRSRAETVSRFVYWLNRLGYMQEDLNTLNAIHITGSKGKGSTAAFVNSVLQGIAPSAKIGRYTSPQLVTDRERISINGEPISTEMFAKYFFEIWNRFAATDDPDNDNSYMRPTYFWTLTLMAFHIFIQEGCDISIIEVGAGARTDCTNCLQLPIVSAVCSIGLAHVGDIGWTTTEIAWEKGGIFKRGAPGLSIEQEEYAVHKMLEKCARERGASSFTCVDRVTWLKSVQLGLAGPHQEKNASLALYIVQAVLDSERCPPVFAQAASELSHPWNYEVPSVTVSEDSSRSAVSWFSILNLSMSNAAVICNTLFSLIGGVWLLGQFGLDKERFSPGAIISISITCISWGIIAWSLYPKRVEARPNHPLEQFLPPESVSSTLSPSLCCGKVVRALENTRWPGRAEIFRDKESQALLYLDSAHTPESMELAGKWFASHIAETPELPSELAPRRDHVSKGSSQVPLKPRNILVVTFPGGVQNPHKLVESVLRGSSPEKQESELRQRLAFNRIIAASDAVRRRGDLVLDTDYTRQKDVMQFCVNSVGFYECPTDFSMSEAKTSQDVVDAIREEAKDGPCNVLFGGSIHLIGHMYELLDLPLTFVKT